MKNQPKRVLLAIDLTVKDPAFTKRMWAAVKSFTHGHDTVIEPVTVLDRSDAVLGSLLENQIGNFSAVTEKHLAERLLEWGLKGLASPKVLITERSSTQQAVRTLLEYAQTTGCDLIAVSSHSRKGVKRFLLGSFAETLSLQSGVPLLVVNPGQRTVAKASKTVLFPTDFSLESKRGLELACQSFRDRKATVVLFHSSLFPVQIYMEPFYSYPINQSIVEEELKNHIKIGQVWCQELRAKGITSKLVVEKKCRSIAEGILSAIRRQKIHAVAMVSHTGKVEAALLGSTTREVLRNSPVPVWVVHPVAKQGQKAAIPAERSSASAT